MPLAPHNYGHSTTLVGIPAELLASADFNEHPPALHIGGTREANHSLFARLEACATRDEAAACFQDTMDVMFGFEPELRMAVGTDGRRRFRSSYLRLLKGWAFDANSPEAAVLKGWVESRFGLYPTFHGNVITPSSSRDWIAYVDQKMNSRFHNNAINLQLDMLYEFCQWVLRRFGSSGEALIKSVRGKPVEPRVDMTSDISNCCPTPFDKPVLSEVEGLRANGGRKQCLPLPTHLTLYRGTNDFREHPVVEKIGKREAVVRLNNLVSFTADRSLACQFGDYILTAQVPLAKIVFFNELLPLHALRGESEYLVIGGDYRVKVSTL